MCITALARRSARGVCGMMVGQRGTEREYGVCSAPRVALRGLWLPRAAAQRAAARRTVTVEFSFFVANFSFFVANFSFFVVFTFTPLFLEGSRVVLYVL